MSIVDELRKKIDEKAMHRIKNTKYGDILEETTRLFNDIRQAFFEMNKKLDTLHKDLEDIKLEIRNLKDKNEEVDK